jgi:hypothetical protein
VALIVVAGALANKPGNGGAAWTRLSWIRGLIRLGHDVYFVEQIAPAACAFDQSINLTYFRDVAERFGLGARSVLISEGDGVQSAGLSLDELRRVADAADLLVNISGHLTLPALKARFRKRVFIDLDPGYTQYWHQEGLAEERLRDHHWYFTVGWNVGTPSCEIPTGDIAWLPVRQPVVLDDWPFAAGGDQARFTTVSSWRGPFGRVTHNGIQAGSKAHEFRKFVTLPTRVDQRFEIALDVHPADQPDIDLLRGNDWTIVAAADVASDPFGFRRYIQESGAEWSVAQGIYVDTQSGWFSDRTVRYLASGKPALVQDTGLGQTYPVGLGLVPFRTLDDAVRGAEAIADNHDMHAKAARGIAVEFFDSDKVLGPLLATVGVAS